MAAPLTKSTSTFSHPILLKSFSKSTHEPLEPVKERETQRERESEREREREREEKVNKIQVSFFFTRGDP